MGEVGTWDGDLFARFKAATGEPRRRLLGELVRVNEPLVKTLLSQLRGDDTVTRRRMKNNMRVPGAEHLEWEEGLNLARMAFCEAMDRFDPTKGKPAFYTKMWMRHYLQRHIGLSAPVYAPRGCDETMRPKGFVYADDPEEMNRMVEQHAVEVGRYTDEDATPEPDEVEDEPAVVPAPPPRVTLAPARDDRPALDWFLEERCRFASFARVARITLIETFAQEARVRREIKRASLSVDSLLETLEARGVRESRMRARWWSTGQPDVVAAYAGVSLRCLCAAA